MPQERSFSVHSLDYEASIRRITYLNISRAADLFSSKRNDRGSFSVRVWIGESVKGQLYSRTLKCIFGVSMCFISSFTMEKRFAHF